MWKKAKNFFLDHINWCVSVTSRGEMKPDTLWIRFWRLIFWPIPQTHECWCCAATRGMFYGVCITLAWIYGVWPFLLQMVRQVLHGG